MIGLEVSSAIKFRTCLKTHVCASGWVLPSLGTRHSESPGFGHGVIYPNTVLAPRTPKP